MALRDRSTSEHGGNRLMVGQDDPNFPNQVFFLGLTQMEQYVFMSSLSFLAEGFMATSMGSAHGHWRMNALWT